MRFLYKIWSGYDGFVPNRIPDRIVDEHYLWLGWTKYIDVVEKGWECWVFFHGPHSFENGVYVKGFIRRIDRDQQRVLLRLREYSTGSPLTDEETSARIAEVVSVRYRQVFLWPEEWDWVPTCELSSCEDRLCDNCPVWQSYPLICPGHLTPPKRLFGDFIAYVPAYWIIPSRCYVYRDGKHFSNSVNQITHVFGSFKFGEKGYAYPLARGIYEALRIRDLLDAGCLVPVPLSPDKESAGELHRTRQLARELAKLLGAPVRQALRLVRPVSKRAMIAEGYTPSQFEAEYYDALEVSDDLSGFTTVLLVDDVATKGSTLTQAARRLWDVFPDLEIVATTAGQMIVKAVVSSEEGFLD